MGIVHHYPGSEKQYAEADPFPGRSFTLPTTCPHPDCQASDCFIRWGTYPRLARTEITVYRIRIQRIRCKACGRTHSLLPDFLHPYRQYVTRLLQRAILLYLIQGLGWCQVEQHLPTYDGPARSTIREWVDAFAHGAGRLLLDVLIRQLTALDPLSELPEHPPPAHLDRVLDPVKRLSLGRAYLFWHLAEQLYADVKRRVPQIHFSAHQVIPFLLHWLQLQALPPRLFWNPALSTTPIDPF